MVITLVGPQSLAGFPKVQSLAPCSFCYMLMIFRYLWTAQSYYLLMMPRSFDQLDVKPIIIIIIIIFVTVQKSKRLLCTGVIIMHVQVGTKLI